ncbi:hypothetical protein RJ641_019922 [Dillenia turbinata]|uniref:Uncharacterized protein n=1 Tax=Dillenia turbinata TaxID=194707 RepID=A0AAN8YWE7_9MAGN
MSSKGVSMQATSRKLLGLLPFGVALRRIPNLTPHKLISHFNQTSSKLVVLSPTSLKSIHSSNPFHHRSSSFNVTTPQSQTCQNPNPGVHTSYDPGFYKLKMMN